MKRPNLEHLNISDLIDRDYNEGYNAGYYFGLRGWAPKLEDQGTDYSNGYFDGYDSGREGRMNGERT